MLERAEAEAFFSSKEAEEEAKKVPAKTFTPGDVLKVAEDVEEQKTPKVVAPTPEQIIVIKAAILNSQTLEEVARLEKALKSGQIPADLKILDNDRESKNVKEKDDEMVADNVNETDVVPNNKEEQKEDETAPNKLGEGREDEAAPMDQE